MREYKFRGKSIKTGKWLYGSIIKQYTKWCYLKKDVVKVDYTGIIKSVKDVAATMEKVTSIGVPHRVDPETVGQYIDRKDKNNTEIYDGDIINSRCYDEDCHYIIAWDKKKTAFGPLSTAQQDKVYDFHHYWGDKIKVIGNIHEPNKLPEQVRKELKL